jgi:hypothetical protein
MWGLPMTDKDDEPIRRGDALNAVTQTALKWGVTGEPAILIATKGAIAALPAVTPALDCRKWWHYPIEMPLTPEGQGPAIPGKDRIGSITYEVWDQNCKTWASFGNLPDAINDAMQRNAALDVQPAPDEWRDVLQWTDSGEKTLIDWYTGGGDPDGEFARIGLRREMPDGSVVYRTYVATGPWGDPAPMPQPAPDAAPLSPTAVDASAAPDTDAKVAALVEAAMALVEAARLEGVKAALVEAAAISEKQAQEIVDMSAPASAVNALRWTAKQIRALASDPAALEQIINGGPGNE